MSAPFYTTVAFFCVFLSSRLQLNEEAFYPVISILLVQAHYLCAPLVKSLNDA